MLNSIFVAAAALQAAASPSPTDAMPPDPPAAAVDGPLEPVRREASLATREAKELPIREIADRSLNQLADAVVDVWRPSGFAARLALNEIDLMLQPTGGGIGGLCRSTQLLVRFGADRGPGTSPRNTPKTVATPRRAEDISTRELFKVTGPLHRLHSREEEDAADAACGRRRDVKSFMATNLESRTALIPALVGTGQALDERCETLGERADFYPLFGEDKEEVRLFALENVAAIRGLVSGERIPLLEIIFAPGGRDQGLGARMRIKDVTWQWPDRGSPDYGVPRVTIGEVQIEPHRVIYN